MQLYNLKSSLQLLRLLIINADITHLKCVCAPPAQFPITALREIKILQLPETWECGEPHWDLQDKGEDLEGPSRVLLKKFVH